LGRDLSLVAGMWFLSWVIRIGIHGAVFIGSKLFRDLFRVFGLSNEKLGNLILFRPVPHAVFVVFVRQQRQQKRGNVSETASGCVFGRSVIGQKKGRFRL
jgi:hypothetical protein